MQKKSLLAFNFQLKVNTGENLQYKSRLKHQIIFNLYENLINQQRSFTSQKQLEARPYLAPIPNQQPIQLQSQEQQRFVTKLTPICFCPAKQR